VVGEHGVRVVASGRVAWNRAVAEQLEHASGDGGGLAHPSVRVLHGSDAAVAARSALDHRASVLVLGPDVTGNIARAVADLHEEEHGPLPLVVGPMDDLLHVTVALASGAAGYLPESSSPAEVVGAVAAVEAGRVVLPDAVASILLELLRQRGRGIAAVALDGSACRLTHREWEVLVLHLQERQAAEIAAALFVSEGTVRTHLASLHRKLRGCRLEACD
jgi:DNA-binding NarL/FixJ family response regulator